MSQAVEGDGGGVEDDVGESEEEGENDGGRLTDERIMDMPIVDVLEWLNVPEYFF